MNKKLGLAVAGALLAASASAQAGITIPAGDWTLDVSGVVNAYYNHSNTDRAGTAMTGGIAGSTAAGVDKTDTSVTTGLLPNYLAISGKSRQNDLDIAFTISINPGAATSGALDQTPHQENRQAFLTIGDASWGSFKFGKDLGVFGSDAILNDMTLLGVGGAHVNRSNTTTVGGIGTGYIYADWRAQIAYTTPNWNGFQATVAVMQPWDAVGTSAATVNDAQNLKTNAHNTPAFEAKASYAWTGDVAGKVWAEYMQEKYNDVSAGTGTTYTGNYTDSIRVDAWGLGANVNVAGFGLTGYYYDGDGVGTTGKGNLGLFNSGTTSNVNLKKRDSNGGYVQATYVIPTGTKLGVAYGVSKLDNASGEAKSASLVEENRRWTVGAYHPLTKSVNLVAEYSDIKSEAQLSSAKDQKSDVVSVGAILFF